MKKLMKSVISSTSLSTMMFLSQMNVFAQEASQASSKAMPAAVAIGLAAAAGAIAMGMAISKACEGVSRQPEASGKIQTMLMLGLVFIETAIIYALIVAILIIFVL
ncbi:ATP synthase F0 subunit C [Floccifex sp.]|uniref:ATP synthase F0 subunit C n=1 Tax=Floccifex sp. TaxID=2815810 RepID=UPI002A75DDD2|nr:ATP synthase F0 subunit C [Floccifex sp.]MDD7281230.1 ATP synthase F0 subunit C [Erysipelotrichaceae bacterium]MDY2958232.1 ATP synthase F0 subunit C [Floccifex sp.]